MINEILQNVIYPALEEIESIVPRPEKIMKSPDMVVYGENAAFDSLSLVGFIVEIEELVEEEYGVSVTIANEKAMSRTNSPFRTIQTLAEYVAQLIQEEKNEA